MNIRDVYTAPAIKLVRDEVASNRIPYLGEGLFPSAKKASITLKNIKTSKGLPVSLMPSAFDTKSTIRSREGFKLQETEMAFFKESMLVKEQDEQEIMKIQDSSDPFAKEVINTLYDDANTLVDGAIVVPERMRMQLLAPEDGTPRISISADGATYEYNYDPDNEFKTNNFVALSGTSKWDDVANSDPIHDVIDAQEAINDRTGSTPEFMIVSKKTMSLLKKNAKIKDYILAQNTTATVLITEARVKEIFATEANITILVYNKKFKDETGAVQQFYPDGMATLIPSGALGNTWFGMTPEERTLVNKPDANVRIVETGVAVSVTYTEDPVHTKTTVSEICLPSFERLDECYAIKAY